MIPFILIPELILLLDWSQSSKTLSTPTPIIEILPKILKMPKIFCFKFKNIEDPPVTTLAARFTFKQLITEELGTLQHISVY